MPVNFIATVAVEGTGVIPYWNTLKVWVPIISIVLAIKWYFAGTRNTWDRDMHGRVVLITGGTSGVGAVVASELAQRGAQVILLVRNLRDGWLAEYIEDLRDASGNPLIYAEQCDLADLVSIRKFATKWIDNLPPRRVDAVVCCANVAQPPGVPRTASADGIETQFQTNYLGHLHLLNTLAPALRSQPPDRDVRIVLTSCVSAMMGVLDLDDISGDRRPYHPWRSAATVHGTSKLALSLYGCVFQRETNAYERKDQAPCNVHVTVVDPGMMRSPSFKRWFSCGTLLGLGIYLILWPLWWLLLKSSWDGAQSLLYALMSPDVGERTEASFISECRIRVKPPPRGEFENPELQGKIVEASLKLLDTAEKHTVHERAAKEPPKQSNKAGTPHNGASHRPEPPLYPNLTPNNGASTSTASTNFTAAERTEQPKTTTAPKQSNATNEKIKTASIEELKEDQEEIKGDKADTPTKSPNKSAKKRQPRKKDSRRK